MASPGSDLVTDDRYRLVRIDGHQPVESWPLPVERAVLLGRSDPERGAPDVDLEPDRRVSRTHARVWAERSIWLIEDLTSKRGTLVGGREIRGAGPTHLKPWTEIVVGETTLMLAPPGWRRLRGDGLVVDLELAPAVSLALAGLGLPVVSRLLAQNLSSQATTLAGRLAIGLGPFAPPVSVDVPPLGPTARLALPAPALALDRQALERQTEAVDWPLTAELNGRPLYGEAGCRILAHNEWSYAPEHRLSLAAFVQPNHPLVAQLALDALRAERSAEPERLLRALYAHLAESWQLEYQLEPPHWHTASQKIRLPHQALARPERREGQGTCLDLALLFAACLEHLGLQPLVAIVDMTTWRHALVGVRLRPGAGLEPLLFETRRLLDDVVWIDPTGCTRDPDCRLGADEAVRAAIMCLDERPLLFGLDVAAARAESITPLPFAGTPPWSDQVAAAVQAARRHAEAAATPLGTVSLFVGLLGIDGLTRQLVDQTPGSGPAVAERLCRALRLPAGWPDRATRSYRLTVALAESQAKDDGSPWVLERHVLRALLDIRSESLDRALASLGLSRAGLAQVLGAAEPGVASMLSTYSVFQEVRPEG
jgi:hypothetical protein